MPGELKNLVSLAISSGSSKYHHSQQQQRQQEKKGVFEGPLAARGSRVCEDKKQTRRSKAESNGAKRFTKLLSKSVGTVQTCITASSSPFTPPADPVPKKAPVASPESDGSSLLNGGSCASADYSCAQESCACALEAISEDTPKLQSIRRELKIEPDNPWSGMNGTEHGTEERSAAEEASECARHSSAQESHHQAADELDEETLVSSASAKRAIESGNEKEAGERARGWYTTRKSYRSVAYKTWTVGAARKLLNSSSDYDLPPSNGVSNSRMGKGEIEDGSVSDGEEKFYNCTYTRSQEGDLSASVCTTSRVHEEGTAKSRGSPYLDISKLKARKCASSDAVTLFSTLSTGKDSFLSPVDSVPSTSSDKTSSLTQSARKELAEIDKESDDAKEKIVAPSNAGASTAASRQSKNASLGKRHEPSRAALTSRPNLDCQSSRGGGRSWLLMASSSTDDMWRGKIGESHRRSVREPYTNPNPKVHLSKKKPGGSSAGDCFSSEDYFKFTLKKRLLQQRFKNSDSENPFNTGGNIWTCSTTENVTPPLLALDRDIRVALNNFDDFNNAHSQSHPLQTRSSSPTTLSSLMAAAQQCWRQQSERFARRIERASCRGKIENHYQTRGTVAQRMDTFDPFSSPHSLIAESRTAPPHYPTALIRIPPLHLSSSSFSSTSSSSSSMSWISQRNSKQQKNAVLSPLAVSIDANEWAEDAMRDHKHFAGSSFTEKPKTAVNGAVSPFRSSEEAVLFLKKELASMREKDHQILTQLKKLDAEISRRKSETDALAPVRYADSDDLESGECRIDELDRPRLGFGLASREMKRLEQLPASNGAFPAGYSSSPQPAVPPLPTCLQVNFNTL